MNAMTNTSGLIDRLKQILTRQRLILFLAGLLATGVVMIGAVVLLSLVAALAILPVWFKVSLLVATGLVTIFFFYRWALRKLGQGSVDGVAVTLEQQHPDLKGRLIAAVQFARIQKDPGYSHELIRLTEQQALQRAQSLNFGEAVSNRPLWQSGKWFVGGGIFALALFFFLPGMFGHAWNVYSQPNVEVAPPIGFSVFPFPGSTEWVKYRDIEIGASLVGGNFPKNAKLYHRLAGGSWQSSDFDLRLLDHNKNENGDSVSFAMTLRNVTKSFDYYVEAGRVKTEVQTVDVVDRPRVNGIKLSIFYPKYTGLEPTVIDENNGSFSAVVGSRVNMKIETNLPVQEAGLLFDDSSSVDLDVEGKYADGSLTVKESRTYQIRLQDHLGELNPDPIEYYLTAVPDEYPSIDVLSPGFDVNLSDEMLLPLKVRIFDDFGFSSLVLKYTTVSQGRQGEENVAVLHFSDRIKTEGDVEFDWDMDRLNLFPGDYVVYHFEVADNDAIAGPKTTKSRQFLARLPSLEEIIADAEGEGRQRIEDTESLLRKGQEIAKRVQETARKLKSQNRDSRQTEWQEQKELESMLDKNAEMLEDLEKKAEQMEKSLEELNQQSLMSREIMEKLAEVQKLYEEIATPEMKEAQKKLMEALQKMDRKEIEEALKDFEMSQQELMERLERTLALLKKLQAEQQMEAMLRKVEELVEQQHAQNEKTDSLAQEELPQLSDKENQLEQSLQNMKKDLDQLRQTLEEAKMSEVPQAQEFMEQLEKTDADKDMKEMAESLKQQKQEDASQQGKRALSKLSEMLEEMQQQMMAMKGEENEELEREFKMAIDDATYLSKDQEELVGDARKMAQESAALRDMAAKQQDLAGSCTGLQNRIAKLSAASPFVASEIQQIVDDAINGMKMATEGFDSRRSAQAQSNQIDAMVDLNRVALRLMESLDNQKQCNKGGNCDNPAEKLSAMCEKQSDLNQRTKKQCNKPGELGQSQESQMQREALKRLAGEQGTLRKSLEELQAESGGSRSLLGRLDDIANEMKKVEEDLESGEIGPETAERQLRIYSRMLEASRSLQRRDFSEQRKATTADENMTFVPPSLPAEITDDKVDLEDRLRKYLGKDYPAQYEEQIKAYFKALLQTESNGATAQPGQSTN